jgi:lipopolysaccharide transport system ATP-binding protein
MTPPAIVAEGLVKSYQLRVPQPHGPARRVEKRALDGVSFTVSKGEVLGLIGSNGAGKSTLLKILSRITSPTAGRALVYGRVASLLEVGTGMHPDMTGRENVYLNGALLGLSRADVTARLPQILEFAGVGDYLDTPIKRYSSGMRLRLAFAVGAHLAAEVMIVDEVLAVGDAAFQDRCLGAMRDGTRDGRTTLFVSHNMPVVENLCDRVLWLQDGRVVLDGPAQEVVRAYLGQAVARAGARAELAPDLAAAAGFLEATVAGADGRPPVQGGDVVIEARIAVRRPVPGLKVRIALSTLEGHPVCNLNCDDVRQAWDVGPGTYDVRIRLREARLMPQIHKVSLWLYTGAGLTEVLDERPEALTFTPLEADVLGTGCRMLADRGVTWFPVEFDLAPAVAEPERPAVLAVPERT